MLVLAGALLCWAHPAWAQEPASSVEQLTTGDAAVAPSRLTVVPSVGFGWSTETWSDDTALHFRAGATAEYRALRWVTVSLAVRDHFYQREYLAERLDLSGQNLVRAAVPEHKVDIDALFNVDLARLLAEGDTNWSLAVGAGPALRFFVNRAIPSRMIGALAAARGGYVVADGIEVFAGAGYLYNFAASELAVQTVAGTPNAATLYRGGVTLRFPGNAAVQLAYDGETITLSNAYRTYHTASLQLDVSF